MNIFKRWFTSSKEQDIDDSQNPWAGLASYEDPETAERKLKFCGRDDDSYDLSRLIMGNVYVTLYGKSGIGKTSLLNAGVFPELREEQYTPTSIRLGMRDEEHPQSYQTMIIEAIERVVSKVETINVFDEQSNQQSVDYLWNYFVRHRFYDRDDKLTTPVIVFDQFEEVFRGHRDEAETLLCQLDYLNDKDHSLDSCEVDGQPYRYDQNFRFVVSIREDDLYRLEDSIDNCYLPALKRCRYRLRSLSEEGARDAILIPGEGLFDENEKDSIVEAIINKSRNDDGSISTNIISLLCSRIYVDFKRFSTNHITLALVENFIKGNPFERFYNEATSGFSNREKAYIEDNLVDSIGRRNSQPESDFLLHIKNGAVLLDGARKIIQRTSSSSDVGNYRVELIHDSFCETLRKERSNRERRKRYYKLSTLFLSLALILTTAFFFYRLYSSNRMMLENKSRFIAEKVNQLVEGGDSYTAQLLALQVFQNEYPYTYEAGNALLNAVCHKTAYIKKYGCKAIYCPDGSRIATIKNYNGKQAFHTVYLLDALSCSAIDSININNHINCILFSPDGKKVVAGCSGGFLIWDIENNSWSSSEKYLGDINTLSFSPNGHYLATASRDSTIRIWNSKDLKKEFRIIRTLSDVKSIAYSTDGKTITAGFWNVLRTWDTNTYEQIDSCSCPRDYWNSVFYIDSNSICISTEDSTVIWNRKTKNKVNLKGGCAVISKDRTIIASYFISYAPEMRMIYLWDANSYIKVDSLVNNNEFYLKTLSISPDNKNVIISDYSSLRMMEVRPKITPLLIGNNIISAAYSNDSKMILSASWNTSGGSFFPVSIWDAESGALLDNYMSITGPAVEVAFSPDNTHIAFSMENNHIKLLNTESKAIKILDNNVAHLFPTTKIQFSEDGNYLYSISSSDIIKWSVMSGKDVARWAKPSIRCDAMHADENSVLTVFEHFSQKEGSNQIYVVDVKNEKCIFLIDNSSLKTAEFSHQGNLLGVFSYDSIFSLYSLKERKQLFCKKMEAKDCKFDFDKEEKRLAITLNNGSLLILDKKGNVLNKFQWDKYGKDEAPNVIFRKDGKRVAVISYNIKEWFCPPIWEILEETRLRFKNRNLTSEERQQYYLE